MGMYTGLRFIGYIKPEFRKAMKTIAIEGDWSKSDIPEFQRFGMYEDAVFIPNSGLVAYMPSEWAKDKEFEHSYDEETGRWAFQGSLKDYNSIIEKFFELAPFFVERIEHLETYYEEYYSSKEYTLVDNTVILIDAEDVED